MTSLASSTVFGSSVRTQWSKSTSRSTIRLFMKFSCRSVGGRLGGNLTGVGFPTVKTRVWLSPRPA